MAAEIKIENEIRDEQRLVEAWSEAFSLPPYNYTTKTAQDFGQRLTRHAEYEGFRCRVALDEGCVLGFTYGYTDRPGQWWHEQVAEDITGSLGEDEAQLWLDGAFALTELAIVPEAQGRGLGRQLHDALLLEGLLHERALLTVQQEALSATALYRRRGWEVLVPRFSFTGGSEVYDVMGLKLTSEAS